MQIPNQYGAKEDIQITKDEMRKIERAMKRPQFQELLGDYMKEISDPKNREEYDEYLRQLEAEKELPKGMQLVKPEPHFCIKTTLWSKQNKKLTQKFFMNICSCSVVEKPSSEEVVQNDQRGQNWKIPFAIGKIRYDQDKKGDVCNTVDIAFHPHTIGYCNKFPGFQHIVCQTALDAGQKQLGERNEDISKDYKVLKRTKCKGGETALLPVRVDKKGKVTQAEQRQGGMNNVQTKLQKDIMNQVNEHKGKKQADQKDQPKQDEPVVEEEDEAPKKESNEIESEGVCQPKYKFIYSYPLDYSEFLDERQQYVQKRPNKIRCDIRLDKISSIQEVKLDLSEKLLVLDVESKYYLNLTLPYPIVTNGSKAKFDSKTKTLKLEASISPQYLKEQALLDVEKAKERQIVSVVEVVETQEVDEGTQEGYSKVFVEETSQQPVPPAAEIISQEQEREEEIIEENSSPQINYKQLSFHKRYNQNTLFLIINIKGYLVEEVDSILFSPEVIIIRKDPNNTINFIHIQVSGFDNAQSQINLVTDYLIVTLIKNENWDQDEEVQIISYVEQPFQNLLNRLEVLKEERLKLKQQEDQRKREEEQKLEDEKALKAEEVRKQQEANNIINKNKEVSQPEKIENPQPIQQVTEEKSEQDDLTSLKPKIQPQFIDFKKFAPTAFTID